MAAQQVFSRRHMIAMAAAGGLALGDGYHDATAQVAKRIDRFDPALDEIIAPSELACPCLWLSPKSGQLRLLIREQPNKLQALRFVRLPGQQFMIVLDVETSHDPVHGNHS
jgi:hypothetical protein